MVHTHTDAPTCRDRGTKKLCFHLDESRPPRPHMEWPARCRGSGALRCGCPAGTPCLFAVFRLGRLGLALGFHFLGSAAQELGQLGPPQGSGGANDCCAFRRLLGPPASNATRHDSTDVGPSESAMFGSEVPRGTTATACGRRQDFMVGLRLLGGSGVWLSLGRARGSLGGTTRSTAPRASRRERPQTASASRLPLALACRSRGPTEAGRKAKPKLRLGSAS